ncbi:Aste57867_21806 [Aphanomyces stellatus]|uniref:Aste57867_21806 protein n=1 Tax=Aphanomyces stellatus TaxID=120398 RepID=A0A485LII1_9STRA|nr:hypothetical protein As57867_021737 [Aphanomyces stellatus]VFT98475.1 Aste57867_21806 [Aphanomyces stellatus]
MPPVRSPARRSVSQSSLADERPESTSTLTDENLLFTRPPGKPVTVWDDDAGPRTPASRGWSKKRPRSPNSRSKLMPIGQDMKSPRRMHSFLLNFLADDIGTFRTEIDLHQHAIDSGLAVTDATVQEVAHLVPGLKSLKLSHCIDVTDAGIWSVARHCPGLTAIYLGRCEKITDLGLRVLAHQCRLTTVDLSDCVQIGDLALATLAAGSWMIETLVLARCAHVTDAGIAKIAQCCKGLLHLDVSDCAHVGEFGDKALVELGRWCTNLRHLDLFGCRHVRDMGIRAIAAGCPHLHTLKLTGCRDVSSVSIHELADRCHALERLSLAGCIKTQNEDLARLATSCTRLVWLDISGSPNVSNRGIACLARHCKALVHLNLSDCHHVNDTVLETLGKDLKSLTSVSLVQCPRITEAGIDVLTSSCTKLFTLNMTDCPHIRRRYLHQLVTRLEFVDWASGYFGIEPLPNAMELQLQKERRLLEQASAVKIQAVMRGCLARGGVYGAKLRRVERDILPKIQARVRGMLARAAYRRLKLAILQHDKSFVIQRAYRYYRIRIMCRRARRLMRIRLDQEAAIFRGHRDRLRVHRIHDERRRLAQLATRRQAILEVAVIRVQRLWRGHRGRGDFALRKQMLEMRRVQAEKERVAASYLQRIYRGHNGRKDFARRLIERELERQRHAHAMCIQRAHRNHKAWEAHKERKRCEAESRKLRAVVRIQQNWRGVRERQLGTIMLGLVQLRRKEDKAARTIQSMCRGYVSRNFMKAMKMVLAAQQTRDRSILLMQKMFRGYKGRELTEVTVELRKLEVVAKPLFVKIQTYGARVAELSTKVDELKATLAKDQVDEVALTDELDKTMTIKSKFHDSARITGAKQRYLTRYLQVQLADQLQKKRMTIAVESRNLELAVAECAEAERQLRFAKRELQPLTDGVERKTRENRVKRLQVKVRKEKKAATAIQRHFRGFRVRVAVGEGANRWLELFDPAANAKYYYNAWSQERRQRRPLAMDIFGDVKPYNASVWFQCRDDESASFYYYNSRTHEYRWDVPTGDEDMRELFDSQRDQVTARATTRRSIGDGAWEEHVDPETNVAYYYNPTTGESVWSLPPTQAFSSRKSQRSGGRPSARQLNHEPSVQWQYYYGYDVDPASGALVKRATPRSPWIEGFDETYQLPYYYNQLTEEYRWSKPDEFDTPVGEGTLPPMSPAHEWYEHQDKDALTTARTYVTTRDIGAQWAEHVDVETGHVYYYNTVTGETRWSLSPRSAREDPPVGAQTRMPLTLRSTLQAWEGEATHVEYDGRADHVAWLYHSVDEKEWVKAEGILEEILAKERGDTNAWEYIQPSDDSGAMLAGYWYNAETGERG